MKFFVNLIAILTIALNSEAIASNVVSSDDAYNKITKLNSTISWQNNLNSCLYLAQKQNKLIFYIHILGDIKGYT